MHLVSTSELCSVCLQLSICIFIHMFNKSKGGKQKKWGMCEKKKKLFPLESVNAARIQKYHDA